MANNSTIANEITSLIIKNITDYLNQSIDLMKVYENTFSLYITNQSDRVTLICQSPHVIPLVKPQVLNNYSNKTLCEVSVSDIAFWLFALITYITFLVLALTLCMMGEKDEKNDSINETFDDSYCSKCRRRPTINNRTEQFRLTAFPGHSFMASRGSSGR